MCTRFPIKISSRQTSASQGPSIKVSIIPGPLSKNDDTFPERIQGFSIEREELTSELMKDIIEEATERIFGNEPAKERLTEYKR